MIAGPSGCGKSTLLRQFKTALTPHGSIQGQLLFQGVPLKQVDPRTQASKIGFVQQNPDNQIVTDKVWHELAFGLESLGYDRATIRGRVAEMASFFGIQHWFDRDIATLSGGQCQRLALARALLHDSPVYIFDEATSNIDVESENDIMAQIHQLAKTKTVILISHRLVHVADADRIYVMDGGRVVESGSHEQLLATGGHYAKLWAAQQELEHYGKKVHA